MNNFIYNILIYFTSIFIVIFGYSNNYKIAFINPLSVYQNVPQGEYSIKSLQEKLHPQIIELQKKQNHLIYQINKLKNNLPILTIKELNNHRQLLKDTQKFLQNEINNFRQQEIKQEQIITNNFQTLFNDIVGNIAQKENYNLILSLQSVAYADNNNVDITEKVINIMKNNNN